MGGGGKVKGKKKFIVYPETCNYPQERRIRIPLWRGMILASDAYGYNQEMSQVIEMYKPRLVEEGKKGKKGKTIKRVGV